MRFLQAVLADIGPNSIGARRIDVPSRRGQTRIAGSDAHNLQARGQTRIAGRI